MRDANQSSFNKTTIAAAAGIGACIVLAKYHRPIVTKIRQLINYKDPLRYQHVQVISNTIDWYRVLETIKQHCNEYNVLGFDCEWVTVSGGRRPVALIQLATSRGLCALFQLKHIGYIPLELRKILENNEIIKVGVAPDGDAKYLAKDYGICVASTLDVRFMAMLCDCRPGGLGKMSKNYLNVHLDKNWRISCSDWEAKTLTPKQIDYAAKDAHVGIELFRFFADKLSPKPFLTSTKDHIKSIIDEQCFDYLDQPFSGKSSFSVNSSNSNSRNIAGSLEQIRKLSTRQNPLYYNCFLQAPDGELLCTCDKKKALWYISKGIGELISEEPLTVRLKFEPAGRAVGATGEYYQKVKENQCVVCGNRENYSRKNVVPREYRKSFPFVMKDHTSHDVLLLCPKCHQKSNMADLTLRNKLAHECDAPLISKVSGNKLIDIPRLRELKSISRALLVTNEQIPEQRKNDLRARLKVLCPDVEEYSEDFLKSNLNIETTMINENFCAHGEKVVEYYQNKPCGLLGLERVWRKHFLETMKPKCLPELWSVDHNVERLEVRADEGRIDKNDMKIAGVHLNKLILNE